MGGSSEFGRVTLPVDGIAAAVFDLDGVLTDTAAVHAAAWKETFDALFEEVAPAQPAFGDDDYRRHVDGKPRLQGVLDLLAARGVTLPATGPTAEEVAAAKDARFVRHLEVTGVQPFPAALPLLRRLRTAGVALAVVSASRHAHDVLAAGGLDTAVDVVVDGNDAEAWSLPGKPDPATFLEAVRRLGCRPCEALVVEDALAGVAAGRAGGFRTVVGVDRARTGALGPGGADIAVHDLADLRVGEDDRWTIVIDPESAAASRAADAVLCCSNGRFGVRGTVVAEEPERPWLTLLAGAFGRGRDGQIRLLPGPALAPVGRRGATQRRLLHLRTGVVTDGSAVFASAVRPELLVIRVDEPLPPAPRPLRAPVLGPAAALAATFELASGSVDGDAWAETRSERASVRVELRDRPSGTGAVRLAAVGSSDDAPALRSSLDTATADGFDRLLAEQRRAWADRWATADVEIDGDDDAQRAIRLALYHLLCAAPADGIAGVGARGLTGLAYSGHVFWDADVFVLPTLAATAPAAARSMLRYREATLAAAIARASAEGCPGARMPWESADTGEDVTPRVVRGVDGRDVRILTGDHEIHIASDVAWAADLYWRWTGDRSLEPLRRRLVVEAARWLASRVEVDGDGSAHLRTVMGPDEYHEVVDDDVFTNGMARWHLRHAAALTEDPSLTARFTTLADALVTGFDAATRVHEQFAGFHSLEPLRIADISPVPVAADVLLGAERVTGAQVVKQPDVLMLHHLLGDLLPEGSLHADLDHYLPRTAHGSSLSPGVCAALLARDGRPEEALALFATTARLDVDDITGTTSQGLHLGALGGLWQAVVHGFAGISPRPGVLCVDPHLPQRWSRLRIRLLFHGVPVDLVLRHDLVEITAASPTPVRLGSTVGVTPLRGERTSKGWRTT